MQAHNTFDAPDQVRPIEFQGAAIQANQLTITLPAMSVVVLELN
jgi:alpha-N-arabinofuranosidase